MTDSAEGDDLETLRRLAVDLAKDGHIELGESAAAVHNLIQKVNEKDTET